MSVSTYQINAFIYRLDEAQRLYVGHCLAFSKRMREAVEEYGITREEFCKAMDIAPTTYKRFLSGAHNYDVSQMAAFSALLSRLMLEKATEQIKEDAEVVKFPKYKHQQQKEGK